MTRGKKLLFATVAAFLALVLLEGLLSLLWLIPDYRRFRAEQPTAAEFKEESHSRYDPELGWVHIPGKRIEDFYGPGAPITINDEGFRGDELYLTGKPPGRYRVVCLGDSFTLGYGVGDDDTYAAVLERLNPRVQAVNMGQGGYSVGQDYLWYQRRGDALDADLLLVAIIADDIWRMAGNRTANGYGKPVFRLDGEEVVVEGQPVPEKIATGAPIVEGSLLLRFLLQESSLARTFGVILPDPPSGPEPQEADELMAVTLAMLRDLEQDSRRQGRAFAIVLLPEMRELTEASAVEAYGQVSDILSRFTTARRIPFLDLRPAFAAQGPTARSFYLDEIWHHYSPAGHRFVAQELNTWLGEVVLGYPG
ncbi:MAG: SGNH/GDSL hydrolase family protein [Acidobacteriota bacterium]|nr:SGNH/GDSL hydrolase family protein [Acidobacteriota bacterium]